MAQQPELHPACALCGKYGNTCGDEEASLAMALDQAEQRWAFRDRARQWVVDHANREVVNSFHVLRDIRLREYHETLASQPHHALLQRYNGLPPGLSPAVAANAQAEAAAAYEALQAAISKDWSNCCRRYPEILDYFFDLLTVRHPAEDDPRITHPRYGAGAASTDGHAVAPYSSRHAQARARARSERHGGPPAPVIPGADPRYGP